MGTEIISLREFARRLNVGEKTIRDGVRLGKISKGVIIENGKPKINYFIALKEAQDIGLGLKSFTSKCINTSVIPATEIGDNKIPSHASLKIKTSNNDNSEDHEHIAGLGPDTSLVTASRAEKIFKAQLACIIVDEKAGTLINKEEANLQFAEFSIRIKSEFESMPGRISSKLASMNDTNEVARELAKEIGKSLNRLSDIIDEERVFK